MAFYKPICKFTNTPLSEPVTSASTGKMGFPNLYKKNIGLGVEVEFLPEFNAEGYQKNRKNIVGVFDYSTKKSAYEFVNNKGAIKCNDEIQNKGIKLGRAQQPNDNGSYGNAPQQPQLPIDDELPF